MSDTELDALSLWVEHGSLFATRCAHVSSSLRTARAVALDAVEDRSKTPMPDVKSRNVSSAGAANPGHMGRGAVFPGIGARQVSGDLHSVRVRERSELRAIRKRHRLALRVAEDARRAAAVERFRAEEARLAEIELQRRQSEERARKSAEAAAIAAQKELRKAEAEREEEARREAERVAALEAEKKAVEERRKAEDERKLKEKADKEKIEAAKATATLDLPKHVIEAGNVWAQVSAEAKMFATDPSMKKPRSLLKKRVNRSVNQIASSVKKVCGTIESLLATIAEASNSGIPSAVSFTLKEIAERLVAEGGLSIALSSSAAFSVGAVVSGVVAHAPDPSRFQQIILAAYFSKCVYVIPSYVKRAKGETDDSLRKRLGYLSDEKQEAYIERMCGYVSSFAAVVQTREVYGPSGVTAMKNPFALDQAWSWLARVSNGPQWPITPDIVIAFLDIAGFELSRAFGQHFRKLLHSVAQSCVVNAHPKARPGAKARLNALVAEFEQAGGRISEVPRGKVLPLNDAENRV